MTDATGLQQTCSGPGVERLALERPLYDAGWPEVADEADVIFVYERAPNESAAHLSFLVADDTQANEVGRRQVAGWEEWIGESGC